MVSKIPQMALHELNTWQSAVLVLGPTSGKTEQNETQQTHRDTA